VRKVGGSSSAISTFVFSCLRIGDKIVDEVEAVDILQSDTPICVMLFPYRVGVPWHSADISLQTYLYGHTCAFSVSTV